MRIGELVKDYRKKYDLTMQEFAERADLSKSYISMLEKGKHPQNNREIVPSLDTLYKIAKAMNLTIDELTKILDDNQLVAVNQSQARPPRRAFRVPVLGRVAAGIPIEVIEEVVDWEDLPEDEFKDVPESYFGLKIKGDSMTPRICDGDTVIVHQQPDAESGEIVIAMVNGDDAVCKRLKKYADSIALISTNPSYEPLTFSAEE